MKTAAAFALALLIAVPAWAQEKKLTAVSYTLNWYPQAEHGGLYHAKADGIFERYGLDVTLRPGGPQVNVHQLLAAGQTDFIMGTAVRTLAARSQGANGSRAQRIPISPKPGATSAP